MGPVACGRRARERRAGCARRAVAGRGPRLGFGGRPAAAAAGTYCTRARREGGAGAPPALRLPAPFRARVPCRRARQVAGALHRHRPGPRAGPAGCCPRPGRARHRAPLGATRPTQCARGGGIQGDPGFPPRSLHYGPDSRARARVPALAPRSTCPSRSWCCAVRLRVPSEGNPILSCHSPRAVLFSGGCDPTRRMAPSLNLSRFKHLTPPAESRCPRGLTPSPERITMVSHSCCQQHGKLVMSENKGSQPKVAHRTWYSTCLTVTSTFFSRRLDLVGRTYTLTARHLFFNLQPISRHEIPESQSLESGMPGRLIKSLLFRGTENRPARPSDSGFRNPDS